MNLELSLRQFFLKLNCLFTARVRSTRKGNVFSYSTTVGGGGGGGHPSLWSQIPSQPLVSCPFWGQYIDTPLSCHWSCPKSSSRSCLGGGGGGHPSYDKTWGTPQPGQGSYPLPQSGYQDWEPPPPTGQGVPRDRRASDATPWAVLLLRRQEDVLL